MITLESEMQKLRAIIGDSGGPWTAMFHCVLRDTAEEFVNIQTKLQKDRDYRVVESRGMFAVERRLML